MTATVSVPVPTHVTARRPMSRASTSAQRRSGRLRLTRRGRVVVVLLLLLALLAVGFTLGRVSHAPAAESGATRVVVVQPGDTLWSIAARVEPTRDTRRAVAQLTTMNHLTGASLQVGQRLTVPA